jgi:hypothetical protein
MDDREGGMGYYADSHGNDNGHIGLRESKKLGESCKQNSEMKNLTSDRMSLKT